MTTDIYKNYPELALHIDGEWIKAEHRKTLPVLNPATGKAIAQLPIVEKADLDLALESAKKGFATWRNSTPEERAAVLNGAARLLRERSEIIATNATIEEGKTLSETRIEVLACAGLFEFYAAEAKRLYGRVLVRPKGSRSIVMREPVGPVAAFAPWNFPIHNPGRKLGAPVATGCSVILKPGEEAPASAMAVVQALLDAGLPKGVVQLVFGIPDEISTHLLASNIIRKVSFTGSTIVGKHLMKLAAETAKRTTMELGGHAPVIICDDADLNKAVSMLTMAKSRNAGQVCVSPTRFHVQEGIYNKFLDAFNSSYGNLKIGDGLEEGVQMGPMANARRPEAVRNFVDDAVKNSGKIIAGGTSENREGFFFRPTILTEVSKNARIMNEEPFGPAVIINPFRSIDEAIEEANRLPYGLASYVFTENGRTANYISDSIESGMVGVNSVMLAAADAPFQGVKESGHGSEDGPEGMAACLVTKSIHYM